MKLLKLRQAHSRVMRINSLQQSKRLARHDTTDRVRNVKLMSRFCSCLHLVINNKVRG